MTTEADLALVGRTIAGKFAILAHLGGGAMGSVYRAHQMALEKTVAIKVMHRELSRDPMFAQRFLREAKAASRIDHPNSMRVLDFGEEPDGTLYMAMEFLDGRDLFGVLKAEWPLSAARIAEILMQTCAALAVAHDMGVVHRDLKPENIMVLAGKDDEGLTRDVVKVCDFGIAKIIDKRADLTKTDGPRLTTAGLLVGTPEYMSPEQGRGESLDARADVYSLGIILFQMLTSKVPFEAESALGIVLKHVTDQPPKPSSLNPFADRGLEAICMKALKKAREDRYQTVRDMRTDLRKVLESAEEAGGETLITSGLSSPTSTATVLSPDQPHATTDASKAKTLVAAIESHPTPARNDRVTPQRVAAEPGGLPRANLERSASKITPLGTNIEEPIETPRVRMTGLVVAVVLVLGTVGGLAWYVRGHGPKPTLAAADDSTAQGSTSSSTGAPTDAGSVTGSASNALSPSSSSSASAISGSAPSSTVASAGSSAAVGTVSGGGAGPHGMGSVKAKPVSTNGRASPTGGGEAAAAPGGVASGDGGTTGEGRAKGAEDNAAPWSPSSAQVRIAKITVTGNTTVHAVRAQVNALNFTLCYQRALAGATARPAASHALVHIETNDQMTVKKATFNLTSGPRVPDAAAQCVIDFLLDKSLRAPALSTTGPATADVELAYLSD